MKKTIITFTIIFFALGFYWSFKSKSSFSSFLKKPFKEGSYSESSTVKNNDPLLKNEDKTSPVTDTASNSNNQIPSAPKLPEVKFEEVGAFGIADPPLSRETVVSHFNNGMVEDGILIKVSFKEIKKYYEEGKIYEMPTIDGHTVYVIPKKVIVNPNGMTTFIGHLEQDKDERSISVAQEVILMFLNEELISGQMWEKDKTYTIAKGRAGTYLVEPSKDIKFD